MISRTSNRHEVIAKSWVRLLTNHKDYSVGGTPSHVADTILFEGEGQIYVCFHG
jgi:hypothetical protein